MRQLMINIYYKNRVLQSNQKPGPLHKFKAGLRSLSILAIITSSCAAIANDNDMQTGSESTLEVIQIIGNKVTSTSENGSRLGLSLKEMPATIDIISGDAIRLRNDFSLLNAVTRSAGFSGAGNPGNGGTSISARGFTGQDAVTKLYDGNRNFTLAGTLTFPFDTWAVERIEILKGPASVLYGLGGIAGAYNVIPKSPSEEFEADIRLSVGENNTQFLGASVNGALAESLVGRADISVSKSDNWVSNGASESEMAALALKWQASDTLALTIRHDAGEQSPLRYFGIPLVDGDFNKDWVGLNLNVGDSQINYDDRITRLIADWNISDSVSLNAELFSLNTDRYWKTVETYSTNSDNGLIKRADPLIIGHELKQQGVRGNLVFNSNIGDVGWKSSVGFELTDVSMKYTSNFNSSHPNSVDWDGDTDLVDPANFSAGLWSDLTDSVAALDQVSDVSQVALFAETQLRFTNKFALVSGLRYDIIKTDYERLTYNEFGVRDTDVDNSVNQKVTPLMVRLGFVYDLNQETALYGQVSTGDTHPNGGDIVRVQNSLREADTVKVKQTEIGIKQSLMERRLSWNLAIFNIVRKNMLIDDPDNSDPAVFTLVPEQTAQGIEVGLDYLLNESLVTYINAAMVDSERDTGSEKTPTPYSPDITLNAGLLYNATERILFGADLRYVDERPYENTPLPSYTLVDLFLGYSFNESARLTFNAKNISDELYATSDHWAGSQWSVGEPRTLSLTLDLNF
jgi:iron complex outermembrane receptor protein